MTAIVRSLLVLAVALAAGSGVSRGAPAAAAAPASVPADIRAVFGKPAYATSTWGLRVLDGKRVLIDLHPGRQFLIGSVRKVFSVGQLLDAVGPSHTYDTPVYRRGAVSGGVLAGDLILVASGDLTMGGRTLPDGSIAVSNWDHNEADSLGNAILTSPNPIAGYLRLARAVKAAGIDRIKGDVAIDDRLFQPFDFRNQFYVRPIFVNDDVVDLSVQPGGTPGSRANVTHRPISAALSIENQLRVGEPKSKETVKIDPELPACIGTPSCHAAISGSLPTDYVPPLTGQRTLVQTVRIVQPANYARAIFIEALEAAGVAVTAPKVEPNPVSLLPAKGSYRAADLVAQLKGMPYGADAKLVLKVSYNIGADTSLMLFGVTKNATTMSGALAAERQNLAARYGIGPGEYHFVDGSGGGETTATNGAVTAMLEALADKPWFPAFRDALPVLGVDGSLAFVKDFAADPSLAGAIGQVRAKTGTFVAGNESGIVLKGQALGGYVTTKSGRHLTFELVVNHVPITGILDVTKVFQDEGAIAAMLWRDY